MVDRFVLSAAADRLIYGSETYFDAEDARTLLSQIPRHPSPWFAFALRGKSPGGRAGGYAAGVGNVNLKDGRERQFDYSTDQDRTTRAGQWKMTWNRSRSTQFIEIEQVMADVTDEGRAARIHYDLSGEPRAMDIQVNRSWRVGILMIVIPTWRPWKTPA